MDRRTRNLRLLSVALLLFGLVYEAGHLRHHWEHARHQAGHTTGDDHGEHRDCLVFHAGAVVETVVELPPVAASPALLCTDRTTRPTAAAPVLPPASRAPPASC